MPKKKKDDDNYYQSDEYKKFSEQRRKKYNQQIANGEIKGEIKKVSPFWSIFEKNKFLFFGIPLIIIFFVLPTFDIFYPFQFLVEVIFDSLDVPVLGGIVGGLVFVLWKIVQVFALICGSIGIVLAVGLFLFVPSSLVVILFGKTFELSDRYTKLPRFRGRKPINQKVGIALFILFSIFVSSSLVGAIPFVFLKIIAILYAAWIFYILLGWLDKGGIKANAGELTTIASGILKVIGIIGGIYILVNLPNTVVSFLIFGPIVFGLLWNLFIWIKNRKK